ncbi:hypothetical protein JCM10207_008350 [Rhodosporidiobolus poonsookiae]
MVNLSLVLSAAALASVATAAPAKRAASATVTATAAPNAGAATSDVWPPANTMPDANVFPPESVVGYQQATPTGVEPFLATASSYPVRGDIYPLVVPQPSSTGSSKAAKDKKDFNIARYWGNLTPQYSVDSSKYGLDYATPAIPKNCEIVQFHTYFRHGARYPTSGAAPQSFADKVQNATKVDGSFSASGPLSFLNDWTYGLGAELLTPYGRLQNFKWGVAARQLYGKLLNNMTEAGQLPVFRTQSQDRMVKTMQNFAAGFFGVPEFLDQYSLEIGVETKGLNTSGAPYEVCPNSNNARGSVGSTASTAFATPYYEKAAARLNQHLSGSLTLEASDIGALLQLCAYETDAFGFSDFCALFTAEEFEVFEQAFDISFSGNNGFNSPVAAAQGLGYLEEFVSRLTQTHISNYDSSANSTLDSSDVTFPLNQSIYADSAHEVAIMGALLFPLSFFPSPHSHTVPTDKLSTDHTYVASQVVPFGTIWQAQVLECQPSVPTKQIRFIINDAVIPIHKSYKGCNEDPNGLCAFDTVVEVLKERINEIDFDYDCNANYTVPTYGQVTNGRAPRE